MVNANKNNCCLNKFTKVQLTIFLSIVFKGNFQNMSLQNDQNLTSVFLCLRDIIIAFRFLNAIINGKKKKELQRNLNIS